jgi:hypothetical protein
MFQLIPTWNVPVNSYLECTSSFLLGLIQLNPTGMFQLIPDWNVPTESYLE